jgi:hypothetical protein
MLLTVEIVIEMTGVYRCSSGAILLPQLKSVWRWMCVHVCV